MKLVIRADAGPDIGAGHLMRCLALGQAWVDHGYGPVEVVSCDLPVRLEARVLAESWVINRINGARGTDADADRTAFAAKGAAIVLDGYHFSLKYQRSVRRASAALMVVDDCGDRDGYDCDVLLNQNPHAHAAMYPGKSPDCVLLGTSYVLLRREFLRQSPREVRTTRPESILLTLGGSDVQDATLLLLTALSAPEFAAFKLRVVIASGCSGMQQVESLASQLGAEVIEAAVDMASLMRAADVAITGAGTTLYETLHLGLPTACVVLADNQAPGSQALAADGLIHVLGRLEQLDVNSARRSLAGWLASHATLRHMAAEGPRRIDGLGAARVAARLAGAALSCPPRP